MKNTTDLIELIKSASKIEKKLFSINFDDEKNSSKKYTKLMHLLEKSITDLPKEYTPSDANDLYEKFQKTLTTANYNKTITSKVRNHLNFIEVLYSKGLFNQCLKHILSCKKIIIQHELFHNFYELTKVEKKIYGIYNQFEKIEKVKKEEDVIAKTIDINNQYEELYFQISSLRSKYNNLLIPDVGLELEKIINNPLLQNNPSPPTLSAKLRYIEINSIYCYLHRNKSKELEYAIQKDTFLKKNWPGFIQDFPYDYIAFYSRFLYLKHSMKSSDFLTSIRFFLNFPYSLKNHNKFVEAFVWTYYYNFKLEILIRNKSFSKAIKTIQSINTKQLSLFDSAPSLLKITFFYRLSYIYFINEDYEDSLNSINIVINEHDNSQAKDLFIMAKLFNIIIHIEFRHFSLINNLSKQLKRQLKSTNNNSEFYLFLLKSFYKLSLTYNNNEELAIYKEIYEYLMKNEQGFINSKVSNYFDITSWLKSKINKTSMYEEITHH